MPPEDATKLVSFVMGGRNDGYLGDFKWRLSAALNYLADNLAGLRRLAAAEILVTDWNSEEPLAADLPLGWAARRITRFVRVPPSIALAAQKDSPFPYVIVQNVGIRRATGKFIAQTDSDILYPRRSLESLFQVLSAGAYLQVPLDRALFVASRRHLPLSVAQKQPDLHEIDRYLALYGNMLKVDRLSVGFLAPSALTLMHRSLWEACGGFDERLIYWEWMDIDLYLRVTQRYPWFDLANAGVQLYHLEHYPCEDRLRERKTNPWAVPPDFRNQNSPAWGLWEQPLEIQNSENAKSIVEARPSEEPPRSRRREEADSSIAPSRPPPHVGGYEGGATAMPAEPDLGRSAFSQKTAEEVRREIGDPDVLKLVQEAAKFAPGIPAEFSALRALAWHSLRGRPARYLEFGIRCANAAAVVALAYPVVEIYGIDSWAPLKGKPNVSIYYCAETLTRLEHRGYLRFVTGNPNTALKRLCDGFVGKPEFDLILFRGDMFGELAFPQAIEALSRLAPGGMMVVSFESSAEFLDFWRLFRCAADEDESVELDGTTGLILKRIARQG